MNRPFSVVLWDDSADQYVDLTSYIDSNIDFDFLSDEQDILYIGHNSRFTGIYADLSVGGSYGSVSYHYLSDGSEWRNVQLKDSYNFSESKYVRWVLPPTNWVRTQFTSEFPHDATPISDYEYYWIKISASSITSAAKISKLRVFPYASYTTPEKVSNFLQIKRNFDYSTTPTDLAVEDLIRRSEDYIMYRTRKSWRAEAVTEETEPILVDHNRYGFYLRHRNFTKVYSVDLWDGGSWKRLQEGRNGDYFINYDLGMIYITRLFLLPATYGMSGRYTLWGHGEFKNSIKVDYLYGRNPETDSEFFIAEDIATKLTARDILQHSDFSDLIVSGSDKVPYSEKIRLLTEDIELKLESLSGTILV